jgi:hypothetical protein
MINLGIRRNLRKWLLKGDNVYCSCCGKHYAAFWFFGKPVRFNALCPSCGSLERHRLFWNFLFLQENNLIKNGMKLLHIAPEKVLFNRLSTFNGVEYFLVDKFMPGYRYPKETQEIDILNITYPENFFDAILCVHVLEHVTDDIYTSYERVLSRIKARRLGSVTSTHRL